MTGGDLLVDDAASHDSLCAAVFRSHFRQMVGLARLLGAADPESTAQEAYLKLHMHSGRLRNETAAVPYLRTIVINATRSEHRHRSTAWRLSHPLNLRDDQSQPMYPSEGRHSELIDALKALSHRHREALVLRYWLDLSEREMAKEMNVSVGTVKAHVARGLQSLRAVLAKEESR